MLMDLSRILVALAKDRPIFHSEADFQHALAWCIHEQLPAVDVRLEYRPSKLSEKTYVDIWVRDAKATCAIELKYKTRKLSVTVNEEPFMLLNQSAQDQARYDFCRDIARLERLQKAYEGLVGFAVFLTNDPSYWRESRRDRTVDGAFRVHENANLEGQLAWAGHASDGTMNGRTGAICLSGSYGMTWLPYSMCDDSRNNEFRMLIAKVGHDDRE
jgi:hypothetical protein